MYETFKRETISFSFYLEKNSAVLMQAQIIVFLKIYK